MKASIKFRDDDRPLLRAKVPVGVLGLPFLSGLAAGGDAKDLRFDLSTAFPTGPALRLSYRPNDPLQPFALSVRTGLGPLGSPAGAPFALSAEFNVLSSNPPAFSLLFKPRIGDFGLASSVRSASPPPAPAPAPLAIKMADLTTNDDGDDRDVHHSFSFSGNGFAANVAAAAGKGGGGVGALLSGMRLTTRSVLPMWNKARLRFQWGLRVPPEIKAALADDGYGRKAGSLAISKLPLLVMNKITIEHTPNAASQPETERRKKKDAPRSGEGDKFSLMKRQLEALNVESVMLRRAVEDLRAEIGSGKCEGRKLSAAPPPLQQPFPVKPDLHYQGNGKELGNGAGLKQASSDDASEELKKALEARQK
ncbi:hypothetical protein PR202_gb22220 [Eleusine coracana subsp. coracana]|uniref:Uncharacterized protein n=1 Tax=Eleusine coracana subsp. coracana TaxID=191504 RepID=A0AAV5FH47_ELECO|nr:hypothetical protein PR202_gb22220 [Eleusine coracana subsp. coracana]